MKCNHCDSSLAGRRRNAKFCSEACRWAYNNSRRTTKTKAEAPIALPVRRHPIDAAVEDWRIAYQSHPDYVGVLLDLLADPDTHFQLDYRSLPKPVKTIARRIIDMSVIDRLGLANRLNEENARDPYQPSMAQIQEARDENRQLDRILGAWDSLPADVRMKATADMIAVCAGEAPKRRHSEAVTRIFDQVRTLKPTTRCLLGPMSFMAPETDLSVEYRRSAALQSAVNDWHAVTAKLPEHVSVLSKAAVDPHAMFSVDLRRLPKPVADLAGRLFNFSPRLRMEFSNLIGLSVSA